jgi:hypothetical protein
LQQCQDYPFDIHIARHGEVLGRCSRTPRAFLALFLFGSYVAVSAAVAPAVDAVGFNGVANARSVLAYLLAGAAALAGGYAWNRRA